MHPSRAVRIYPSRAMRINRNRLPARRAFMPLSFVFAWDRGRLSSGFETVGGSSRYCNASLERNSASRFR